MGREDTTIPRILRKSRSPGSEVSGEASAVSGSLILKLSLYSLSGSFDFCGFHRLRNLSRLFFYNRPFRLRLGDQHHQTLQVQLRPCPPAYLHQPLLILLQIARSQERVRQSQRSPASHLLPNNLLKLLPLTLPLLRNNQRHTRCQRGQIVDPPASHPRLLRSQRPLQSYKVSHLLLPIRTRLVITQSLRLDLLHLKIEILQRLVKLSQDLEILFPETRLQLPGSSAGNSSSFEEEHVSRPLHTLRIVRLLLRHFARGATASIGIGIGRLNGEP